MLTETEEQVFDTLLVGWDGLASESWKVKPEIMSIIKSYFPGGNMVFDMGEAYQKIHLCVADLQYFVEDILPELDPADISDAVTQVLIQILGIQRAWSFMVKHGLVVSNEDNLEWV